MKDLTQEKDHMFVKWQIALKLLQMHLIVLNIKTGLIHQWYVLKVLVYNHSLSIKPLLWSLKESVLKNTIQYNTIQYNTIQYNTIQYSTVQYNTVQYNTIQY